MHDSIIILSEVKNPEQKKIREAKKVWNKKTSNFIHQLIEFKKLMNGRESEFHKEKSKITQPIPVEPSIVLQGLASVFKEMADNATAIGDAQKHYSGNYKQASNKLTRFLSYLKGPHFGDDEVAKNNRARKSLLSLIASLNKDLKDLNSSVLKRSNNSILESKAIFNRYRKTLSILNSFVNTLEDPNPPALPEAEKKDKSNESHKDKFEIGHNIPTKEGLEVHYLKNINPQNGEGDIKYAESLKNILHKVMLKSDHHDDDDHVRNLLLELIDEILEINQKIDFTNEDEERFSYVVAVAQRIKRLKDLLKTTFPLSLRSPVSNAPLKSFYLSMADKNFPKKEGYKSGRPVGSKNQPKENKDNNQKINDTDQVKSEPEIIQPIETKQEAKTIDVLKEKFDQVKDLIKPYALVSPLIKLFESESAEDNLVFLIRLYKEYSSVPEEKRNDFVNLILSAKFANINKVNKNTVINNYDAVNELLDNLIDSKDKIEEQNIKEEANKPIDESKSRAITVDAVNTFNNFAGILKVVLATDPNYKFPNTFFALVNKEDAFNLKDLTISLLDEIKKISSNEDLFKRSKNDSEINLIETIKGLFKDISNKYADLDLSNGITNENASKIEAFFDDLNSIFLTKDQLHFIRLKLFFDMPTVDSFTNTIKYLYNAKELINFKNTFDDQLNNLNSVLKESGGFKLIGKDNKVEKEIDEFNIETFLKYIRNKNIPKNVKSYTTGQFLNSIIEALKKDFNSLGIHTGIYSLQQALYLFKLYLKDSNHLPKQANRAFDWAKRKMHEISFWNKTSPIRLKISDLCKDAKAASNEMLDSLEVELNIDLLKKYQKLMLSYYSKINNLVDSLVANSEKYQSSDIDDLLDKRYLGQYDLSDKDEKDLYKKLEKRRQTKLLNEIQ